MHGCGIHALIHLTAHLEGQRNSPTAWRLLPGAEEGGTHGKDSSGVAGRWWAERPRLFPAQETRLIMAVVDSSWLWVIKIAKPEQTS